jgi:small subunit ribosomal protein S1
MLEENKKNDVEETNDVTSETAVEETDTTDTTDDEVVEEEEVADEAVAMEDPIEDEEEEDVDDVNIEELFTQNTGAFDDFDWTATNKHGQAYTADQRQKYVDQYDHTLTSLLENEIVKGRVTAINAGDVVLDVNFKSDGLVSLGDFKDMPDLKIGDFVDVYVEKQEDERGQLVLSRRKAKLLRSWEAIKDSFENGTVIRGTVISKTKGGLIVDCSGLETFLPGSQIDIKPILDYDQFVGKQMDFKVVKIN